MRVTVPATALVRPSRTDDQMVTSDGRDLRLLDPGLRLLEV